MRIVMRKEIFPKVKFFPTGVLHDVDKGIIGDTIVNGLSIGGRWGGKQEMNLECLELWVNWWVQFYHIARRLIEQQKSRATQDIRKK
eukprot:14045990-Ditylum_brightwellii.AAC.1